MNELKTEIDYLKTIIINQSTKVSNLDRELDDQNQYNTNRRENVIFTNINIDPSLDAKSVIADLCQEIGADVEASDMVDAHPLPNSKGKPFKVIARFLERSKAKDVFTKRKNCKNINTELKNKLISRKSRGVGIHPNLTVKKGRLLYQDKQFCDKFNYHGAWADFHNGKIYLKTTSSVRGIVIKDTSDLIQINSDFEPLPRDYIFCTPPLFDFNDTPAPSVNDNDSDM